MKRPMVWIACLYIGGIALQYQFYNGFQIIIFSMALTFTFGLFAGELNRYGVFGLLLIIALLGSLNFKNHYEYEGQLRHFVNQEITIIGDIWNQQAGTSIQYTVLSQEIHTVEKKTVVKEKLLIHVSKGEEAELPRLGDRVVLTGTLRIPERRRNPGMFDYHLYLKAKDTHTVMYLKPWQIGTIGEGQIPLFLKYIGKIKVSISEKIRQIFPEEEGNMLLAVLMGEKNLLEEKQQKIYRNTGIAHIFAVSGLHVGIIFIFLNKFLGKLRNSTRTIFILCCLWCYAAVTGFSPSVMRAAALISILICAPFLNRKYDSLSAIGTAAVLFLAFNPTLLMHVGFQLSFAAALSIALLYSPIYKQLGRVPDMPRQLLSASAAAQLGTMPLLAYHFNLLSPIALLLNIPVIFIIGYLVPLGFLTVVISFIYMTAAKLIGKIILLLIYGVNCLSQWAYQFPYSYFHVVSPSMFFMLIYYLILYISVSKNSYFLKKNKSIRQRAVFFIISIYFGIILILNIIPKNQEIIFVDVGQGDCTLIRTAEGKNILIDGGGSFRKDLEEEEEKDKFLIEFLLKNHISRIHMIILSHPHGDHMGGLFEVVRKMPVEALIVSKDTLQRSEWTPLQQDCQENRVKVVYAEKGDLMRIDEKTVFSVLSPGKELLRGSRDDANNNSLVVLLEHDGKRILFTGDIEEAMEQLLLQEYSSIPVDVLKVPHHGSRFSTTEDFLDRFPPRIAVIQVGRNNFGHPHPQVLDRLNHRNIDIYRNDQQGAIRMTIKNGDLQIHPMLDFR
ncbi:DNA internalization-related competence protein ComEC/Rec2 [Geosporobacter ferrireducens]|uniref:DNA internalization-related competence protein ComEC/Rec2 n=1 Tax=Geosporobacter ferrireducens TaxID=1424294 RepID=A0A1D8GC99_9FIRM|nr:DNA internalization-related competence protein ComEC/Rec2 [Geosporobacter ferrireducens]AOT68543.1 DNA internalization-related competence protein ComEC/Rec2 [Geosporobacter ferrireducens]MTI54009.1 DNA internalization-related competence protein ComEC/Rec2 [Geosporobacter ferrireducens]